MIICVACNALKSPAIALVSGVEVILATRHPKDWLNFFGLGDFKALVDNQWTSNHEISDFLPVDTYNFTTMLVR